MLLVIRRSTCYRHLQGCHKVNIYSIQVNQTHSLVEIEIEKATRIINEYPYPDRRLRLALVSKVTTSVISTTFVENVLGQLFASHSNGLKAYEFFKFSLSQSQYTPSSDAFEKTLHILARMRYFTKAWELLKTIKKTHPSLLTTKSMSILLSRIAKFQSYDDTLEAFEKMEKGVFCSKKVGTEEFNVLLRAFCTQRQMIEARSVFNKMHPRFIPNTKTMNILLLGFKESGDVTTVELFYHDMILRGFMADNVTYNIRIDAYCKRGCLGDALRLFEEMERVGCLPTLETITTLIHGAGVTRNKGKAKQLFRKILTRGLKPDVGAYNAFISSLIRCRDIKSAFSIMDEMVEKNISLDNVTYHTMFSGLMKFRDTGGVLEMFTKMTERNFVPATRTVVMLLKFFCVNHMVDLGVNLWNYLLDKGHCPHSHALDLLVTGLCFHGRVQVAFECTKQLLERGRCTSELVIRMLSQHLPQEEKVDKFKKLEYMMKQLRIVLPPPLVHGKVSRTSPRKRL